MKIYPVAADFIDLSLVEQISKGVNLYRAEDGPGTWADGFTPEDAEEKLIKIRARKKGVIA